MQHMISRRLITSTLVLGTLFAVVACGDSSTAPGGEQELITRVTLTLTPTGGGTPITTFINDPDGAGPLPPAAQVGALALAAGRRYSGTILFENRLENPPENITEEVEEEADEHRVFYTVTGPGVTITTTDVDSQGRPLGLRFSANASAAGSGNIRVVLCHYSDNPKPAAATTCAFDTDIDVTFNYSVSN